MLLKKTKSGQWISLLQLNCVSFALFLQCCLTVNSKFLYFLFVQLAGVISHQPRAFESIEASLVIIEPEPMVGAHDWWRCGLCLRWQPWAYSSRLSSLEPDYLHCPLEDALIQIHIDCFCKTLWLSVKCALSGANTFTMVEGSLVGLISNIHSFGMPEVAGDLSVHLTVVKPLWRSLTKQRLQMGILLLSK